MSTRHALVLLIAVLLVSLTSRFRGSRSAAAPTHRKAAPDMIPTPPSRSMPPVQTVIAGLGYLSSDPGSCDNIFVTFTYYPGHPYSTLMDISANHPHDIEMSDSALWEVSREVIHDGVVLGVPSGVGTDFSVTSLPSGWMQLRLLATDEDGRNAGYHYDMYLSCSDLLEWLMRTMDVVPMGRESEHLDMDYELRMLLS